MSYTSTEIQEMRDSVIDLIPKLIYAGISDEGEIALDAQGAPDAFDISVHEVLKRIADLKQNFQP